MGSSKSFLITSLMCLFLGIFGIHRLYVGKYISGILMMLTLGGLGIWTIIDLLSIISGNFTDKNGDVVSSKLIGRVLDVLDSIGTKIPGFGALNPTSRRNYRPSGSPPPGDTRLPITGNPPAQSRPTFTHINKPAQYFTIGCLVVVIAVVALIVVAFMSVEVVTSPYAGGRWSCDTFRSVQNDITNGLLTIPEMREEVKKVQSRGSTAEPEIAAASTALLAFLTSAGFSPTQQDLDGILNASLAMTAACKKYGY